MKVLFDHQIFSLQNFGGISKYFSNVIKFCSESKRIIPLYPFKYSSNIHLNQISNNKFKIPFFLRFNFIGKKKIIGLLNEFFLTKAIKKNEFDIFHPTYYETYFINILRKPYILTVHDMIHEIFPNEFKKKRDYTLNHKATSIKNASHIIAISETTKNDLIKFHNVPNDKITVIYHGLNLSYSTSKIDYLPSKYILFVGDRKGYKNFDVVLKSLQLIKTKDIILVCTGKPFSKVEKKHFKMLNLSKYIIHFSVNDNELNYLYENALSLIYPSKYEGFGFPIIEAHRAKCPVILSNSSCFPEIGANAARYFDENDYVKLAELIIETNNFTIEDKNRWINLGLNNLKRFNLETSMNSTIKVYEKIINSNLISCPT